MNWRDHIDAEKIALYVAGTLPSDEMEQIRSLEMSHADLADEILQIESSMMEYASNFSAELPGLDLDVFESKAANPPTEAKAKKVVKFNVPKAKAQIRSLKIQRMAAAILAIVAVGAVVKLYEDNTRLKSKLTAVREKEIGLELKMASLSKEYQQSQKDLSGQLALNESLTNHLSDTNTVRVRMDGQAIDPNATAEVFWNKSSQKVILHVLNLPEPPEGHQYQLWALADGKPIDAGVFDVTGDLQSQIEISAADAFAVTLEPQGGSESPTLEKLFVIGNI